MKRSPVISVLMPVYNGEKYLEESIKSILNQTFRDFELLIVNDCSTDNSLKIIKSFMKKDKRIKLINNKKNKGFIGSLNIGLNSIKSKYIAANNQDDVSHEKRLEIEFNYLEKNSHIFLIGTSAIAIDKNGTEIGKFRKYNDPKLLAWRLRKSNGIIYPSIMFRNEGVFFDRSHEYGLYYRLLKNGKNLANLENFLVKYRIHSNALSNTDKINQNMLFLEVKKKFENLDNNLSIIKIIYYHFKIIFHGIRTLIEKRNFLNKILFSSNNL